MSATASEDGRPDERESGSDPAGGSPPPAPRRDERGETIGFAGRIQAGGGDADEGWRHLAAKVEAFLRRAHGRTQLPHGIEFEDLLQLVFCKLLGEIPRLELRTSVEFWGFVKLVADNTIIDLFRRGDAQKRGKGQIPPQQRGDDGEDRLANREDADAWSASVFARAADIEERELDCVNSLPREESRSVYLARRRDGRAYEDIARETGRANPTTVKVIYKRARDRVLQCLRDKLDGYETFFGA